MKDFEKKDEKKILLILCLFGGAWGLHYFYCKNIKKGLLYLLTFGIFTFGWLIDILFLIKLNLESPQKKLKRKGIIITTRSKSVVNPYKNAVPYEIYSDAYIKRKAKNITNNYVVFDTETTGLEPEIDKIIEISAIKFKDNKRVDTFTTLVNPLILINDFISELTGIKQEELYGKPTIDKVLPDFFEFIEDYTLIAHNAKFDIKMLACECYRNNIELCNNKIIDTVFLAKKLIPYENIRDYKLTTIKNYLGLNYKSHRALNDCEVCAKIYQLYLANQQRKKIIIVDNDTGEIIEEIN